MARKSAICGGVYRVASLEMSSESCEPRERQSKHTLRVHSAASRNKQRATAEGREQQRARALLTMPTYRTSAASGVGGTLTRRISRCKNASSRLIAAQKESKPASAARREVETESGGRT